jgi:hypothetical protein
MTLSLKTLVLKATPACAIMGLQRKEIGDTVRKELVNGPR